MTNNTKIKTYDCYIVCEDDLQWENEMVTTLQDIGHNVYSRRQFRLGKFTSRERLHGIKNCKVLVIGFVSPSKKKNDVASLLTALALEMFNFKENHLIPIYISKDAIIPEELCTFPAIQYETRWSEMVSKISHSIKSLKSEMDTQNSDNTTGHPLADLSTNQTNSTRMEKKYAVARGRKPGIYDTWKECEAQIKGFRGAKHKSFNTKLDAENFIRDNREPMGKQKCFAVARGMKPGIYDTWKECEAQIKGFSGAKYKSFGTKLDADNFVKDNREPREPRNKRTFYEEKGKNHEYGEPRTKRPF